MDVENPPVIERGVSREQDGGPDIVALDDSRRINQAETDEIAARSEIGQVQRKLGGCRCLNDEPLRCRPQLRVLFRRQEIQARLLLSDPREAEPSHAAIDAHRRERDARRGSDDRLDPIAGRVVDDPHRRALVHDRHGA
jgi:hypothetical protein